MSVDVSSGKLRGLGVCEGGGGLTLALAPWVQTVAYCEKDPYCVALLLSRMRDVQLPVAPIWDDLRTLSVSEIAPLLPIDIIYGGFPCQDVSNAGPRVGLEGERSGLFFEILRLAKEIQPAFLFLENVPGLRTRGLTRIIAELSLAGYVGRAIPLSALEVGAPHIRNRVFILATHADLLTLRDEQQWRSGRWAWRVSNEGEALPGVDGSTGEVADSESVRLSGRREGRGGSENSGWCGLDARRSGETLANAGGLGLGVERPSYDDNGSDASGEESHRFRPGVRKECWWEGWWETEPNVGRVVDGVPARLDGLELVGHSLVRRRTGKPEDAQAVRLALRRYRLQVLGNAVVPAQAREAFMRLVGLK